MDFLSEIISARRPRINAAKKRAPIESLRELARHSRSGSRRLSEVLRDRRRPNLIAEFKRRSPSKGRINSQADPANMAQIYESAGAVAVSVLTEEDHFDGSLDDLRRVREATSLPLLRKDFIVDEYQVYESAAAGADAVLLIVAALDDEALMRLRAIAEDELAMDALVEVHSTQELARALDCGARLIGVNNRDLRTFEVSTSVSDVLRDNAPDDSILVSESGLTPSDVRRLWNIGYSGFLIGETLMRSADPSRTIRDFLGEPATLSQRSVIVKICGITNVEDARVAVESGADMLGFNFYPGSPRFIEPAAARVIIATLRSEPPAPGPAVTTLGVFVNESREHIVRTTAEAGVDGFQLHGDETPEFCRRLKADAPQRILLKAIRPNGPIDLASLDSYGADAFMFDAYDPGRHGGTGRIANWELAREAARRLPRLFLAGGLSPENVAAAIEAVRPYAVDACSALEIAPGKKDKTRVREFVAAVRASKLPPELSRA